MWKWNHGESNHGPLDWHSNTILLSRETLAVYWHAHIHLIVNRGVWMTPQIALAVDLNSWKWQMINPWIDLRNWFWINKLQLVKTDCYWLFWIWYVWYVHQIKVCELERVNRFEKMWKNWWIEIHENGECINARIENRANTSTGASTNPKNFDLN